jgi:alpha-beta hydrolase superfamily lysophospholipase
MSKTILMIHGVGCGGDVWDNFRLLFENSGWRVETPTLFPEERTTENPPETLKALRLSDYIDQASAIARRITQETGEKPAVMGHSMGGLIAQHLAVKGDASAAIFLTPAQTPDCQSFDLRLLRTFWNILKNGQKKIGQGAFKVGPEGFSWGVLNKVPKERHDEIYTLARYDSGKVYLDLGKPEPIDENAVKIPTLTVGAKKDRATPIKAVRKVGEKYASAGVAGDYMEYADHAHWIVDEPGSERVVADILDWLDEALADATAQSSAPI